MMEILKVPPGFDHVPPKVPLFLTLFLQTVHRDRTGESSDHNVREGNTKS